LGWYIFRGELLNFQALFALLRNLHTLVYPSTSTHEVPQSGVDCRDDAKKRRRKVKAEVPGEFFLRPLFSGDTKERGPFHQSKIGAA